MKSQPVLLDQGVRLANIVLNKQSYLGAEKELPPHKSTTVVQTIKHTLFKSL